MGAKVGTGIHGFPWKGEIEKKNLLGGLGPSRVGNMRIELRECVEGESNERNVFMGVI